MYLNGATLGNQLVFHVIIPQSPVRQVFQQVRIHNLRSETEKTTTQQLFLSVYGQQFGAFS